MLPAAEPAATSANLRERRALGPVLSVMLAALVVRVPLVLQPACIDRNGVQFVEYARRMDADAAGAMRVTTRQPAFAAALLVAHRWLSPLLGGAAPESWQRCGELLALLAGVLACGAVFCLARRAFDARTATLAAILVLFWPQGAETSAQVLSDMPHLALYLAALLTLHAALTTRAVARHALAGALIGLAYLVKQEALGLLLAAGAAQWRLPGVPARRRVVQIAALGACFGGVVAPHSLLVGRLMPNKSPADLQAVSRRPAEATQPPALAYAVPGWQAPLKLIEEWARSGRYVVAGFCLVAWLTRAAPRGEPVATRLVALAVLMHALLFQLRASVYGEISSRYAIVPAALLMPWAAAGWRLLLDLGRKHIAAWGPMARRLAIATIYLAPVAPLVAYVARPVNHGKDHLRRAGQWLRHNGAATETVLAHEHQEQILFYAGHIAPDDAWIRCRRGDDADALHSLIARTRPAWLIDAEQTHAGELDERDHFARLNRLPELRPEFVTGPAGQRVFVWRVALPETSRSAMPGNRAAPPEPPTGQPP